MILARPTAGGFALTVHLTPGASRDEIAGRHLDADGGEVLKVRVRAVPENGKANAALVKLLAKRLGIGKTRLSVTRGMTGRIKTVEILCEPDEMNRLAGQVVEAD